MTWFNRTGGQADDPVIAKLVRLADGHVDLVNEAIRQAKPTASGAADLEHVVQYIVARRERDRNAAAKSA